MLSGCTGKPDSGSDPLDETKTQLYISAYDAGYGQDWLAMYKTEFEDMYKDYVFEEGKKGVQIRVDWNQKNGSVLLADLHNTDKHVFFNQANYYSLVTSGNLMDLTEVVNAPLDEFGEPGKTVKSKISSDFREYLESFDGKYYAIPSHEIIEGVIYDIDLFENEDYGGFYFADSDPAVNPANKRFTTGRPTDISKAEGPDGVSPSYDDGLPATYDEFFELADHMVESSVIPFTWSGISGYQDFLVKDLWVNFEGAEQMKLNFTFSGLAKTLVNVSGGNVTSVGDVEISDSNAYMLMKQEGIYRSLEFVKRLVSHVPAYYSNQAFSGDQNHIAAQEEYLYSSILSSKKPIAFLTEGTYWQAEAAGIFKSITKKYGEEYSAESRRFGVLPMPHYDVSGIGEKNTILNSPITCFARKGITGGALEATKKFMMFINTDDMLYRFMKTTSYSRAINFDITPEQLADLPPFARSIYELKNNSDVIYSISTNPFWMANSDGAFKYALRNNGWCYYSSAANQAPIDNFFYNESLTPEVFFNGMYDVKQKQWQGLYDRYFG
jgi:ABC-type glycerol-3-phosphate transport system substrate-binding protein